MSNCQVIFLNRWLDCPEEIKRRNQLMQVHISEKLAEFHYETRNYTPFQRALSKQKSHNMWRNRMKIIVRNGERVDQEDWEEEIDR